MAGNVSGRYAATAMAMRTATMGNILSRPVSRPVSRFASRFAGRSGLGCVAGVGAGRVVVSAIAHRLRLVLAASA